MLQNRYAYDTLKNVKNQVFFTKSYRKLQNVHKKQTAILRNFKESGAMKKYKIGIIGATGMVGQRFVTLIANHPWFELAVVAASPRSAGKTYEEATSGRWYMNSPVPQAAKNLVVLAVDSDISKITNNVDFVFSAVDMSKEQIKALEEAFAKAECPVISNNSVFRETPDVPMIIPEINPEHMSVIELQRKRLGTKRGFVAVKSNCSIQSYVPALHPLKDKYGLERVLVCTYQAISGAGKTFETWPEMVNNIIPYIGGDEEGKSEREPLKIFLQARKNGHCISRQAEHFGTVYTCPCV